MRVADHELVVRASARIGSMLRGKYRLDKVLGIGGMATVYAATHRNGNEYAIKVLHADLSMRSDLRNRFLREGHVANAVKHPGVVTVIDDDVTDDGSAFLVMERLHGESVETFCERHQKLPLNLVTGIGLQLLDVLAAAHEKGVIHRDIKPGNLFVTTAGHVKVLDFGIARLRDMASSYATQTGMMMGTPAFMAPEQAMAKTSEIDAQTDIWAVGASLFTLATGQLVHPAENAQQIVIRAATRSAPSLASALPGAPPLICEVVDRALAFDKSGRWSGAAAMREALQSAIRAAFGAAPTARNLAYALEELRKEATVVVASDHPQMVISNVAAPPTEESTAPVARESQQTATVVRQPAPAPSPQARPLSRAELVTAQPVSSDSVLRRVRASLFPQPKSFTRGAMFALAGLSVVLVVLVARSSSGPAAPAPALAVSATAPAEGTGAGTESRPDNDMPTESAGLLPLVSVDQLPPASGPSSPHPASAVPTAAAPPAPKANCNPPYTFDVQGNRKWKRECLR